jgi:hypothetical protein
MARNGHILHMPNEWMNEWMNANSLHSTKLPHETFSPTKSIFVSWFCWYVSFLLFRVHSTYCYTGWPCHLPFSYRSFFDTDAWNWRLQCKVYLKVQKVSEKIKSP